MVVSCLMPLCLGITVIIEPVFNEKLFCHDLWKYKLTMTLGSTSLWLSVMKDKEISQIDLSFLRYPITGGEQLLPGIEDLVNHFLAEKNCKFRILQGWGMCELGM